MGYKILVVGDADELGRMASDLAVHAGYSVTAAATGTEGMKVARADGADLVIVDADLPDMAGLAWVRMLRQTEEGREIPVLLSGRGKSEAEVAEAFDAGADDFIAKPVRPEELSARLRAVLRRRFEREERLGYAMRLGPIVLDPACHECRVRGRPVALRPREFELLEILIRKAGRVLSRTYLLESIWGMSRQANTRAVDVGVSRLRRALGPRAARWIETVERFGYRFRKVTT